MPRDILVESTLELATTELVRRNIERRNELNYACFCVNQLTPYLHSRGLARTRLTMIRIRVQRDTETITSRAHSFYTFDCFQKAAKTTVIGSEVPSC